MRLLKHLPNFLTLLNALCGMLCIIGIHEEKNVSYLALFFVLANLLDWLDGLMARLLNAQSDLGLQLDSLADAISFVAFPSFLIYHMLEDYSSYAYLAVIPLALGILRLARFNVSTTDIPGFFKGLPTPAFALFVFGSFVCLSDESPLQIPFYFLLAFYAVLAILLNSNYPFMSLKIPALKIRFLLPRMLVLLSPIALLFYPSFYSIVIILILYRIISIIAFKIEHEIRS